MDLEHLYRPHDGPYDGVFFAADEEDGPPACRRHYESTKGHPRAAEELRSAALAAHPDFAALERRPSNARRHVC